jgi:hypothetical protein
MLVNTKNNSTSKAAPIEVAPNNNNVMARKKKVKKSPTTPRSIARLPVVRLSKGDDAATDPNKEKDPNFEEEQQFKPDPSGAR